VIIRTALERDWPRLQVLARALGPLLDDPAELEKSFTAILTARDQRIWVLEVDDTVLGWLHAVVALRIGVAPFVEIVGLAVADNYRRRGAGQNLVAAAAKWAASRNLSLKVRSNSRRTGAHDFYYAQGFTLQKQQHVFERPTTAQFPRASG
tara:strand:- start:33411 stop:33863 length:453 start_codon:yes stop_codon:yes gene_type:complete